MWGLWYRARPCGPTAWLKPLGYLSMKLCNLGWRRYCTDLRRLIYPFEYIGYMARVASYVYTVCRHVQQLYNQDNIYQEMEEEKNFSLILYIHGTSMPGEILWIWFLWLKIPRDVPEWNLIIILIYSTILDPQDWPLSKLRWLILSMYVKYIKRIFFKREYCKSPYPIGRKVEVLEVLQIVGDIFSQNNRKLWRKNL